MTWLGPPGKGGVELDPHLSGSSVCTDSMGGALWVGASQDPKLRPTGRPGEEGAVRPATRQRRP